MRVSGHGYYAEFDWLAFQWSFLICISLLLSLMSTWLAFVTCGRRLNTCVLFATWRDEDR
jgi:predicted small integral membrane protein